MTTDRREFLIQGAGALTGIALLPALEELSGASFAAIDVAIVGMGRQGRAIAAELQKIDGVNIVAICDVDAPRLRSGGRRAQGAVAFADHQELLEKTPQASAVFVATPTHQHLQVVKDCLSAGRHVYCEAPLAHTIDDARAIATSARLSDRVFQAGLLGRSNPVYQLARSFYRTESLRQLVSMRAQHNRKTSWRQSASTPERAKRLDWRLDPAVSIGLPGEWGTQQFDVFHWYTGKYPTSVRGAGSIRVHQDGRTIADTVALSLGFADGTVLDYQATLGNSFGGRYEVFHGEMSAIKLAWSHGWMFKEADASTQGWEVYANRQRYFNDEGITLIADATQLASQGKLKDGVGLPNDSLHYGIKDFLSSVVDGTPVTTSAAEGLRATVIGILAQRAVVTGEEIAIGESDLKGSE